MQATSQIRSLCNSIMTPVISYSLFTKCMSSSQILTITETWENLQLWPRDWAAKKPSNNHLPTVLKTFVKVFSFIMLEKLKTIRFNCWSCLICKHRSCLCVDSLYMNQCAWISGLVVSRVSNNVSCGLQVSIHGRCRSSYSTEENMATRAMTITQVVDLNGCKERAEMYRGMAAAVLDEVAKQVCCCLSAATSHAALMN